MEVTPRRLHHLPAVHQLAENAALRPAVERFGRVAVVQAIRATLERLREHPERDRSTPAIVADVQQALDAPPEGLRRVINATGVLLHTNLGRAPYPDAVSAALNEVQGFCDLEMDLASGERASRLRHVEALLCRVTGAAAATAVNNNAAALLLVVAGLARGRPVAISRGHLLEIGGGFRLPGLIEASGSRLYEVGSTNRTHLDDYRTAVSEGAGLVVWVHQANFVMRGYVGEPAMHEVVRLAHAHDVPAVLDLGSGALLDTRDFGLPAELQVREALAHGFDAVCFSGDKLMGGPQAGLLVGSGAALTQLRKHPLARAVRCDKLCLAALAATLTLYEQKRPQEIPLWQLLQQPAQAVRQRVEAWQQALQQGTVLSCHGTVGGGALPESQVEDFALALACAHPQALLAALRQAPVPVVARAAQGQVLLHGRTVFAREEEALVKSVRHALARTGEA